MGERKVKVEIRIGRDEDGDWWTVLMVDDDEALWRGPYERRATAENAGFDLAAELDHLDEKRSGALLRGVSQLGTDTRESYGRSSRAYAEGEGP